MRLHWISNNWVKAESQPNKPKCSGQVWTSHGRNNRNQCLLCFYFRWMMMYYCLFLLFKLLDDWWKDDWDLSRIDLYAQDALGEELWSLCTEVKFFPTKGGKQYPHGPGFVYRGHKDRRLLTQILFAALKEKCTDFTPEGQITSHEDDCSACENSCIMFVLCHRRSSSLKKSQFGLGEYKCIRENLW